MERIPVVSSNVAEVGYDEASGTLEVAFKDGSVYNYFAVPGVVYEELLATSGRGESVGKYLNVNVKKVGYRYTKL